MQFSKCDVQSIWSVVNGLKPPDIPSHVPHIPSHVHVYSHWSSVCWGEYWDFKVHTTNHHVSLVSAHVSWRTTQKRNVYTNQSRNSWAGKWFLLLKCLWIENLKQVTSAGWNGLRLREAFWWFDWLPVQYNIEELYCAHILPLVNGWILRWFICFIKMLVSWSTTLIQTIP